MRNLTVGMWFQLSDEDRRDAVLSTFQKYRSSSVWYNDFNRYIESDEFMPLFDAFMREVRRFRVSHEHFGAKAIWEIIRYESHAKDSDQLFKVNNNYTSSVANLTVLMFPELEEFFERRRRVA